MIINCHIKLKLFNFLCLIAVMTCSCNRAEQQRLELDIYHYSSDDDKVQEMEYWFSENYQDLCSELSIDAIKFNLINLNKSNQLLASDNQISLIDRLQTKDQIWAVNSTDLLRDNLLKTKQNHFVDDIKLMESVISFYCHADSINNIAIVYNVSRNHVDPIINEYNTDVPDFDEAQLYDQAYLSFWKFAEAQNLIANEDNEPILKELVENTLRLFISDNSIVQIQNAHDSRPLEITTAQYLSRMQSLSRYSKIKVDWNQDISVLMPWEIEQLERPEYQSNLRGTQRFIGYKDGSISYSDEIDKTIDLHAKLIETIDITGNTVIEWRVFLGDIRVNSDPKSNIQIQT